jgi:hypothetical protein
MESQMLNLKVLACGLAIGSSSLVAIAQPTTGDKPATKQPGDKKPDAQQGDRPGRGGDRGGPGMRGMEPLSAEKAKAAWNLEATSVATRLGLSADQTKTLVTAYESARTDQQAVVEKFRKEQQDKMKDMDQDNRQDAARDMRKAMEDLNKTQKEKLTKAVTTAVPGDNGTKAATALGSYNQVADHMVDTVSGFKLESAKQQNVLKSIEDFSATQAKIALGGPDTDPAERREAMQAAREKFNTAVKKDLTEDQMKKLEESMPGAGRGNGGGGGGGRNRPPEGEKPKDK